MNIRENFEKEQCSKCNMQTNNLYCDEHYNIVEDNKTDCYTNYLEQDRKKLLSQLELKDQQIEKMLEALKDYLEWGAMTSSDRDLFDNRFKELISSITGQSEEGENG